MRRAVRPGSSGPAHARPSQRDTEIRLTSMGRGASRPCAARMWAVELYGLPMVRIANGFTSSAQAR